MALSAVVGWLWFRSIFLEISTSKSVALEWVSLVGLTALVLLAPEMSEKHFRPLIVLLLSVLIVGASWSSERLEGWPEYWGGFGPGVALIAIGLSTIWLAVTWWRAVALLHAKAVVLRIFQLLQRGFGLVGILWTLPTLLQPMDSVLNVGDSTEKVLDEIAGWAVGNPPGIDTSWVYGSLLGLPLAPLQFVEGFGDWKVVFIMLYVNALVIAVPVCMAVVVRSCLPSVDKYFALAVTATSVSISGDPINTALFQELSFLARGLLPVVLGLAAIKVLVIPSSTAQAANIRLVGLGALAAVTFLNNYEYGFGAAVAALLVAGVVSPKTTRGRHRVMCFILGFAAMAGVQLAIGASRGGYSIARRLGVWYDVLSGDGALHSNNDQIEMTILGLPSIYFALTVTCVAVGIRHAAINSWRPAGDAGVSSLYFGTWSLLSAPYFLNAGGSGAFRTQFLMIPVTLLLASIVGILYQKKSSEPDSKQFGDGNAVTSRLVLSTLMDKLPFLLLCSVLVTAVVQVPHGLVEWRRIQTPEASFRNLDEWSPDQLDWIRPAQVKELASPFGGESMVGWWYHHGNTIELLTGIENLLGVTAWETMRSERQARLACEPLVSTRKKYVVSGAEEKSRIEKCGGLRVRAITPPNDFGLSVFELIRS